jgi:hypothetical protein
MVMMRWFVGPCGEKVFERGNKECEIGGTDISYIEIGVWMLI